MYCRYMIVSRQACHYVPKKNLKYQQNSDRNSSFIECENAKISKLARIYIYIYIYIDSLNVSVLSVYVVYNNI